MGLLHCEDGGTNRCGDEVGLHRGPVGHIPCAQSHLPIWGRPSPSSGLTRHRLQALQKPELDAHPSRQPPPHPVGRQVEGLVQC